MSNCNVHEVYGVNKVRVLYKKLHKDVILPKYETEFAAGCDICAHLEERVLIGPGETKLIPTGLKVAVPNGFEIQVRPRSGLSLKTSLRIANSPGTIDADYRGEIGILAHNCSCSEVIEVTPKQKIAQLIVAPVLQAVFTECDELPETKRGEGGFGSTGK